MKNSWIVLLFIPIIAHVSYPIYEDDFIPPASTEEQDIDEKGYQALREKLVQENGGGASLPAREPAAKVRSAKPKARALRQHPDRPRVTQRDGSKSKILPKIEADAEEIEGGVIQEEEAASKKSEPRKLSKNTRRSKAARLGKQAN